MSSACTCHLKDEICWFCGFKVAKLRVGELKKESDQLSDLYDKVIEHREELLEKVERYEKAINKSFLQIDLVYTDESDADSALNYVFKYLKSALKE